MYLSNILLINFFHIYIHYYSVPASSGKSVASTGVQVTKLSNGVTVASEDRNGNVSIILITTQWSILFFYRIYKINIKK